MGLFTALSSASRLQRQTTMLVESRLRIHVNFVQFLLDSCYQSIDRLVDLCIVRCSPTFRANDVIVVRQRVLVASKRFANESFPVIAVRGISGAFGNGYTESWPIPGRERGVQDQGTVGDDDTLFEGAFKLSR